jgi:hypothetical protein
MADLDTLAEEMRAADALAEHAKAEACPEAVEQAHTGYAALRHGDQPAFTGPRPTRVGQRISADLRAGSGVHRNNDHREVRQPRRTTTAGRRPPSAGAQAAVSRRPGPA